eukprot:CAMPEP_0172306166 /NCGR_PEP_ID=MMETSP1058-20130122/7292_1 /TAXON_ID=83371 /ORGANISM="Detonula confervacea, Strain CCMP 353" /LENGTH=400 /DNA_ID=CAMNT_0013017969 /DNA_START=63 /DNA_END=1265 /DNA_ORIENTATION=+
MVLSLPSLLLLAAAALAPPTGVHSLSIKPTPPRSQPPKSARTAWNHSGGRNSRQQQSSTTPLRAYTVADNHRNDNNPWSSFLKFPMSFADLASQFDRAEDSLFSFEGGGEVKPATRPYMPNLEMEAATITAANQKGLDIIYEKDELFLELNALTKTFDDLQSSMDYKSQVFSETIKTYKYMVESLEEKNVSLEEGLQALTVTLERQGHQLQEVKQEKEDAVAAKKLEGDNEMLRQRLRALELELSEVAFASRKVVPTPPPPVTVENTVVIAQTTDAKDSSSVEAVATSRVNTAKLSPKAPSAPVPPHIYQQGQLAATSRINTAKLSPKAPVPPHIYQQRQLEELQLKMEEYKQERSSVRKLFGLGIRRGMNKVGRAVNLWNPVHNLLLWGELRGHGKVLV